MDAHKRWCFSQKNGTKKEMTWNELQSAIQQQGNFDEKRIEGAYQLAEKVHHGQKRKTGEPYLSHPVAVAQSLFDIGADEETIIAALLHDTIEDTILTVQEISSQFGESIGHLVDAVTKVSKTKFFGSFDSQKTATFRKILSGSVLDERAIIIKLADRAHNVETISEFLKTKQQRIAQETMDIYYPLAKVFGIWKFKKTYEDFCFPIIHPDVFQELHKNLSGWKTEIFRDSKKVISEIESDFQKQFLYFEIRPSFYSPADIFYEMEAKNIPSSEIHPFHIDVIVENASECYAALGALHKKYFWKEKEFADYISIPKSNGYQGIHTSVFTSMSKPLEFHIKTRAMNYSNQSGSYFFSPESFLKKPFQNSLHALDKNYYFSQQFWSDLHKDVLQKKILTFTRQGKAMALPVHASGIDFSYVSDAKKAHYLEDIKINGILQPITTILQNGDVVEPIYSRFPKAENFWLNHTRTGIAKYHMLHWFSGLTKQQKYIMGRAALVREFLKIGESYEKMMSRKMKKILDNEYPENSFRQIIEKVGEGVISPKEFLEKYLECKKKIREESFFLSHFDKWKEAFYAKFFFLFTANVLNPNSQIVQINIEAKDRQGMLYDILGIFAKRKINVATLRVYSLRPSRNALYKIGIEVERYSQVSEIFDELLEVHGVRNLTRG
ncbi:bifunctional (p)ppGpp synthetase/guanosine-3',5'-bis(diphosphate) 3'-pyrophosphohydrolase [Candidatus Peregrinibacteria bacterium]|nr:MAG: bifunctional (p)ppGpp synthetase/guanosine-3',5'-bis(diphosphate) 3'-pyrophosphohydrolase [Candidatus Peregrinibacteria bacterium]